MKKGKRSEKGEKKKTKKRGGVLRLFRWGTLLPVLLLAAFGVALFAVPAGDMRALSIATGAVLCLVAFLLFLGAFGGNAGVFHIVCGAALVALAVWLFVQPEEARNVLYYVLTGVVFLRAVVGLFYALLAKRKESRLWQISMAGSIFLLVCAVVYVFLPMLKLDVQNVLIGVLCCLDALIECAALLHRLRAGKETKETAKEPKNEQKKGERRENVPEEKPAPPEPQEPQEADEKAEQTSFWQRFRSKKGKS